MTRQDLRKELAELRGLLELRERRTIDEWEAIPQDLRDALAARAFIAEWGDYSAALIRLGFPAMNRLPPRAVGAYSDYVRRVFGTPGVEAILKRDLAKIDDGRESMLARQAQIALHGGNAESTRAFEAIAGVCRWASLGSPSSRHRSGTLAAPPRPL
jgi:hypothetical protein